MVAAFEKRRGKRLASKLESTTLRGFGGGWNAIDEDLSMPPKYQVALVNMHRTSSGSQAVRFGQKFVCDIKAVNNSPILDGIYFNARSVVVCANGRVVSINEDASSIVVIWSPTIAAALPGTPGGWSTTLNFVCFTPFKNTLIIHNGIDKPIIIASNFTVKYLQDEATGSNVNVPIGKYGCAAANYHCVAGIPNKPTEITLSSKETPGVFPGDPEPNDAISFDVGAYAPEGAALIRGIAGFRTYLLVFLQNITLQIKLGEHEEDVHIPKFPDTLPQFGILGNRTIVTVENDLIFCGLSGLASAKRNLYSPDSITSDYLSSIVSPAYRKTVGALTPSQQLETAFGVFDRLNNDFMLFLTGGRVMLYTFNPRLKMNAWSTYENLDFKAGWSSILGRLFLVKGTKIFLGGNSTFADENYYADRIGDRDYTYTSGIATFTVGDLVLDSVTQEIWECTVTHPGTGLATFEQERENHPSKWLLYQGRSIKIEFELPWIDGKDPAKLKQLRYISVATKGDAEFSFDAYVDNLFKDSNGVMLTDYDGQTIKPAVSMVFIGNDAYGYGYDDGPYGMGRRSRDPRLYGFPVKFKTIKFRMTGDVRKRLEFVNLTFLYSRGKFTR